MIGKGDNGYMLIGFFGQSEIDALYFTTDTGDLTQSRA